MKIIKGKVLIVAGSDSGGGAGIQADIKTVTSLGGYASTAITALTAQNTRGVQAIHPVPAEFVGQQLDSILSDIGADVIKTGMLHDEDIVETLVEKLEKYPDIPLVVDPVMVAKGGDTLLEQSAISTLTEKLLPFALLVTPNIPEAEMLSSTLISNEEGMANAAKRIIRNTGCAAVLVKGGHLSGNMLTDVLVMGDAVQKFHSTRIDTPHTHGTGCTLASAIATYLAQAHPLPMAIEKARQYLHKAITYAPGFGHGHGPLGHNWTVTGN